jgi:hypothetical protein
MKLHPRQLAISAIKALLSQAHSKRDKRLKNNSRRCGFDLVGVLVGHLLDEQCAS